MLVTVIATLCTLAEPSAANLPEKCISVVVTNEATLMQCGGAFAAQVLPHWMEENGYSARGYRLEKWSCVIGGQRRSTT